MIPRGVERVSRRKLDFPQSLGFECQVPKFNVGEFLGKKPFSTDFRKQNGQFRRGKEGFVGGLKFVGEETHGLTVLRGIDHNEVGYRYPNLIMVDECVPHHVPLGIYT